MNYIYCGSHLPLIFALYLKQSGQKITVVTCSEDVTRFCTSQNIDYIQLEYIRPTVLSINRVFSLKNMLDQTIEKIDCRKNDSFFLTGNTKSYDSFYLAKELSKKGCVIYYVNTLGVEYKKYKRQWFKPIFLRGGILRFFFKLIMNLDLIYHMGSGIPIYGIDSKFKEKYNIIEYPLNLSQEEMILEVAKKSKGDSKEYNNLIIDEGSLNNRLKPGSLKKIYKNLSELPLKYSFKRHPRPTKQHSLSNSLSYKLFKHCDEIPRYIPVELLLNKVKRNVISVYSASLYTASQFEHINAISLLELVEWRNDSVKNETKNQLIIKSNNRILFPTSFEELKKILTSS